MINKDDVLTVAEAIGIKPIKEQIQEVLDTYEAEVYETKDTSWELIVENILYTILVT